MKIITALENPKTNEKLKEERNFEVIGNDIQYQEGVIEILNKNPEIDLIIISELLTGQVGFKELIEKIKTINKRIEIIAILKRENEEIKNYLISKGVFNIFYNNKITNNELIDTINNINNTRKEVEINEEIKNLKKIILEKNNSNRKMLNKEIVSKNYFKIKNIILGKLNLKNKKEKISNKNKIISIVGTNGIGKSIFSSLLAKTIKNKKILLIDFDIFNQSINSIFNVKRKNTKKEKRQINKEKNNINNLIIKVNKNIDLICATNILFDEKYKIEKNKIKIFLEELSSKYDLIIIDTTSECFFDYTKEILEKTDLIIFLTQANLIELKKSKNLLDIYINKWKINIQKFNIVFNKDNINAVDDKILKTIFSDFKIIGKIKKNKNFDFIINNNLKNIDKKIKKKFERIIKKINLEEEENE